MTPQEITRRLFELKCVFQAQPKNRPQNPMEGLLGMFGALGSSQDREDYDNMGYNEELEDNDDAQVESVEPDLTLETITDPKALIKHEAWFLGEAPPKTFPARIAGNIMTIGFHERHLLVRMEDVPWGLNAGEVKFACEYITGLDVKNGSLLVFTKVGNVAIQIHEIDESQCIA